MLRVVFLQVFVFWFLQASTMPADSVAVNKYLNTGYGFLVTRPDSALWYSSVALLQSYQAGYKKGTAIAHHNLGSAWWVKGDYPKAFYHFSRFLQCAADLHNEKLLANAYRDLGIIYIDLDELDTALVYTRQAMFLFKKTNNETGILTCDINTGIIYEKQKQYTTAEKYNRSALQLAVKTGNWQYKALVYCNLSSLAIGRHRFPEAIRLIGQSFSNQPDVKVRGHLYINWAKALKGQQLYATAVEKASNALAIARAHRTDEIERDADELLFHIYTELHNQDKALHFYLLYLEIKEKMLGMEKRNIILALKYKMLIRQQAQEIRLQETQLIISQQAKQQTRLYLFISVMALLFLAVTAYLLFKKQQLRLQAERNKILLEKKDKETIALRLQSQQQENTLLKNDLELKNKELLSYALAQSHKNQLLHEIQEHIGKKNGHEDLRNIRSLLSSALDAEQNWEEFRIRFEQVHQTFFDRLKAAYPELSVNDLRLCAFLKLNFTTKQIAALSNIAASSVDISKYRLKKKLNLGPKENIGAFISGF